MGIVVTIFMLAGILMLAPIPLLKPNFKQQQGNFIGVALLLSGLWNSLWHGLRYLSDFWGLAALVSGIFMIAVAVIILKNYSVKAWTSSAVFSQIYVIIKPLHWVWWLGLVFSFLLYSVTLIRLNLGLPIWG